MSGNRKVCMQSMIQIIAIYEVLVSIYSNADGAALLDFPFPGLPYTLLFLCPGLIPTFHTTLSFLCHCQAYFTGLSFLCLAY